VDAAAAPPSRNIVSGWRRRSGGLPVIGAALMAPMECPPPIAVASIVQPGEYPGLLAAQRATALQHQQAAPHPGSVGIVTGYYQTLPTLAEMLM
jgi:hypothetical protein